MNPPNQRNFHPHHTKIIVFMIFLFILLLIIFTAFYDLPLVGNVISEGFDRNNSIHFDAKFTSAPLISARGDFKFMKIEGLSDCFFYVGDQKFPLEEISHNYISLTDFEGEIVFDERNITKLKGKVSRVAVNGISLMPSGKKSIKVSIEEPVNYKLLDITDTVFLDKLEDEFSGRIILDDNKDIFNLDEEFTLIEKFQGDISVDNGDLSLKGEIRALNIKGNHIISVSK